MGGEHDIAAAVYSRAPPAGGSSTSPRVKEHMAATEADVGCRGGIAAAAAPTFSPAVTSPQAGSPRPLPEGMPRVGAGVEERGALCATSSLLPNAVRRERDPTWRGGFSLGVDLGDSRTGLALGKGFCPPRPLLVLELRGQKLEMRIMEIAEQEEVDELILGLPRSWDGKETPQSNKVRSIAGRLAVRAAERGLRVYLLDEHGTSVEALNNMIDMGHKKSARQGRIDSYSAMMVLERYFSTLGHGTELVLPKQLELQEKLERGPCRDADLLT